MREGWREVELRELITQRRDFTAVDPEATYDVLGVQRSGWGFVHRAPVLGGSMKFAKLMRLEQDDLVLRTITAFEAPSAVAGPREAGKYVTPQTFPTFKVDAARLLPAYMRLLTTDPRFHEAMAVRSTGTVLRRKTLSPSAFGTVPVALPSLAEQRRIIDLIGAVDDAIEKAEAGAKAALRSHGSLADALVLGDWPTRAIGERATVLRGAVWSKADETHAAAEGHEEVVGISVTGAGGIDRSKMKFVAGLSERTHRLQDADLLLVGSNGNEHRIGNVYDATELAGRPFSAFQLALRPADASESRLLFHSIAAPSTQAALTASTAGSTGLKNLGSRRLKELQLPSLPVDDRKLNIDALDHALALARASEGSVNALRNLRAKMLSALLSGEHPIPESYDDVMEVAA